MLKSMVTALQAFLLLVSDLPAVGSLAETE
jgi:hypothetical protein